jgi:hypothetical protein
MKNLIVTADNKFIFLLLRSFINDIEQGGPTFFFPRAKNSLPIGLKGQENPPGNYF